ncbi:MAG: TonB-dependent receptor [Capsulimonas sp.]|uniref:TonB-dependent receptor plug domain-containing protein n=1 Tax=Capsulimonas sp. TaxID=2494211 RepID=UPI003265AD63
MVIEIKKTNTGRRNRRMLWGTLGLAASLSGARAGAQQPNSIMVASASGDRDTSADNELLLAGDFIVFTASKTAQRISDSPAAVTVITAEQIQQSGATTIAELMRSVPGVDVMEGNRSQANLAIRGFNNPFSNGVLVMIDERPINVDLQGNVFWNTEPLLLSRIARIEVVRGPGSVLYGADAFGGVINIITKTPQELLAAGKRTSATAAYGEHSSTFIEAANTQGKAGDWAVTVGAGYHGTSGFGERRTGDVRDSARVPILTVDAQKQISRGTLTFSASSADAVADFSPSIMISDMKWRTNSLMLTYSENQGSAPLTARIYRNSSRADGNGFDFNVQVLNVDLQQSRRISSRHHLLYGASFRHGEFQSSLTGKDTHPQEIASAFLQDQIEIDRMTSLFAGVRWDHNSIYPSQLSPRLSLVRHLPRSQSVRFSYGSAFLAPTQINSYEDFSAEVTPGVLFEQTGNMHLKPQKVASFEVGYRRDLEHGYLGVNLFQNTVTDIFGNNTIAFAPPPFPEGTPLVVQWANQGSAHAAGFELESGFLSARGIHGLLNYSYQNVTDDQGEQVDFSPNHKINLVLNTDESRRWTGYLAGHFVGESQARPNTLRAYTTLDASIGYRAGSAEAPWKISLAATNLLDDRHNEYVGGPSSVSQRRTSWLRVDGKF